MTDIARRDLDDGSSLLVTGFDDEDALSSVERQLKASTTTPSPAGDGNGRGGPVRRATRSASVFGIEMLRTLGLQSHELGDAIRTRRDELYRNAFPRLAPRFAAKCEDCGTEFDEDVSECSACGHDSLRQPDPAEKREAEELFESVNREGQSLRELAKYCEPDQWTAGVSCIVIQYDYAIARDSALYDDGEVIAQDPTALVYGDPATIKPVVDEHNRAGGHWWTCPIHRDDPAGEPGACEECGAERREVFFYEDPRDGDDRYYFRDEVVTWAYPMPRLGGLDGLSPIVGVVLRQVVIEMMTRYGAAFYDQDADRLPNQLMVLHTTNADHWEEQMERIRDDDDPYDSRILANEYSPQDSSTPEIQVVDVMPDELLGQSQEVRQDYKEDIRQAVGISNVHDSDLSDAGGLNNEGLQLEVTDRSIASQQHDYIEGWLDTLAKRLGLEDWRIEFLPATDDDAETGLDIRRKVRAGTMAAEAGLDVQWQDGDLVIKDGDFDPPAEGAAAADAAPADDDSDGPGPSIPSPPTESQADVSDLTDSEARRVGDLLFDAHRHIVWAPADDVEQQAEPFFDADEAVPEFVQNLIETVIDNGALGESFETLSASARGRLANVLEENLTQPQGWSLRSLAEDLQDEFGLTGAEAETIARSETASVMNQAREEGYRQQNDADEAVFKWLGPSDERTTEACEFLKEQTRPDHGGDPVTLDELRDLVQEANRRFVDHEGREWLPHINCRHTYVRHRD